MIQYEGFKLQFKNVYMGPGGTSTSELNKKPL